MLLRIIGSPANLELFDGVFTVGSHEDDDIFIEKAAKSHAKFVFINQQVILQSAKDSIYLNGRAITQFPCDIPPMAVLSLNQESHIFFGEDTDEEPGIPTLAVPTTEKSAPTLSKVDPRKLIAFGAAGVFVGLILMAIVNLAPKSAALPKDNHIAEVTLITPEQAKQYITNVVGDHLLAYDEEENVIIVRVLEDDMAMMERWVEDISRLSHKMTKDIQIIPVNANKLTLRVKEKIRQINPSWKVDIKQRTVTVSGVCLPSDCQRARAQLDGIKEDYITVVDAFYELKNANVKIISLTVSKHVAQVVVERNGVIQVVQEGAPVFELGRLNLIRQNGIDIGTAHGTVFIPWHKS